MEVLLLEDIPGVGQKNDIVVVKSGFALNNLLPLRRALVATPTVRRRYAEQIKRRAEEKAQMSELMKSAVGVLKEKSLIFSRKAEEGGKLYGAVTEADICEALTDQLMIEVPEASISVTEPIKAIGEHTAKVMLDDQEAEVRIEVKAE